MKLSSISLVGALAAIVVSAIAAPVPRSLKQLNLFERDIELVDGLFARDPAKDSSYRDSLGCSAHLALADDYLTAAEKHQAAYDAHSHAASLDLGAEERQWHSDQANSHEGEVTHYEAQWRLNYHAAAKVAYKTRTDEEKKLIKHRSNASHNAKDSGDVADVSTKYVKDIIRRYHGQGPHPGEHPKLRYHRHS